MSNTHAEGVFEEGNHCGIFLHCQFRVQHKINHSGEEEAELVLVVDKQFPALGVIRVMKVLTIDALVPLLHDHLNEGENRSLIGRIIK